MPDEVQKFMAVLFNPGEFVNYRQSKDDRDTSVRRVESIPFGTEIVCVNPLWNVDMERNAEKGRRSDRNVIEMRNILIEIDDPSMTREEQIQYVQNLEVPWSTCCFSGSKSIHFVIALSEPLIDRKKWDEIVGWIHNIVEKADHATKNPSVGTRFPEAIRKDTGNPQSLLAVGSRRTLAEVMAWLEKYEDIKPMGRVQKGPPLPEGQKRLPSQFAADMLSYGIPQGQRNAKLFVLCCELAECNFSAEEAYDEIKKSPIDLPDREILTVLRSAYKRCGK